MALEDVCGLRANYFSPLSSSFESNFDPVGLEGAVLGSCNFEIPRDFDVSYFLNIPTVISLR